MSRLGVAQPSPRTPLKMHSNMNSMSTEDSVPEQKARLRVHSSGSLKQDSTGLWKYAGGTTFLESVPTSWRYSDLIFRLVEKTACPVSVKYLLPGEDLEPEALITVADDDDLKEMLDEYQRGLQIPGTPIKTFRLRVFLFPALNEPFTPEEILDGEQFFSRASADRLTSVNSFGRVSSGRTPPDFARSSYSSALSSGSASGANSPHAGVGGSAVALDAQHQPEADAWQAGFEAGQEAAAWARLPSGSLDAENPVMSPDKSVRSADTPRSHYSQQHSKAGMAPNVVSMTARPGVPDGITDGFAAFWQAPDDGSGEAQNNGDSGGHIGLPTHISAFGSSEPSRSSVGPLSPALPQITDMVTSGVRLPSHISAFGETSSDDRLDAEDHFLPDARDASDAGAYLEPVRCEPALLVQPGTAGAHGRRPSVTITSPHALHFPQVHCVPQDQITVMGRIGEGAFGEVSLANSPIFGQVAVKWLKPSKQVERSSETFWGEAEVLASVNHPNVLRFYGVVVESPANPTCIGIMTEYMRGGSLADVIRRYSEEDRMIPLMMRAEIALGAVKGLAYLHAMRIVHFDLKPDNLLLDTPSAGISVKVADFGLHKHKKVDRTYVSGIHDLRGTLPYMAPELVSDPKRVSEKADVWSLGMVLWEMLTLQVPFTNLNPQQIVAGLMVGNLQPPVPSWCEDPWREMLEMCWEVSPAARPNLGDLARQLEHILRMV